MKIVIVSTYFSKYMGYTENCLPRALANMGHEVHVVTSNFNVYGNDVDYAENYQSFLGPADQGSCEFQFDGYTVHRLPSRVIAGYLQIKSLAAKIREIRPNIVHSVEIASLQTYILAAIKPFHGFRLFTESHQHLSVVKPFLKEPGFYPLKRSIYWLTRTLPTFIASATVEKCYAVAPDCLYVAHKFYGVPKKKLVLQSLGSDTSLFFPVCTEEDLQKRASLRHRLGYSDSDLVCVYTGRFTSAKNPLLLAQAINHLSGINPGWHGLFVGEGAQRDEILRCRNTIILPFMTHRELADLYRAVDLAVWPCQESMSMLDAASSGLPLIVSNKIGEIERVKGNGKVFKEGDVDDLCTVLESFSAKNDRLRYGLAGREKMVAHYSWAITANNMSDDYSLSLSRP